MSSLTDLWVPLRICLVVSSANQRSTRFTPGAVGGSEVEVEAGVFQLPAFDLNGGVGGDVVQHYVHI